MKLEQQVLSIKQVRELQELGFDVKKYASMVWINNRLFSKDDTTTQCMIVQVDYTPTMTIGDIIDILPHHKFLLEKGYEDTNMYHLEHKFSSLEGIKILQHESGSFLRLLFDNLKWCIINKHIES